MKLIQLGIGGMGDFWLNIVKRSQAVEYAAFVEINEQIAHEQVEKHGIDPALIFPTLAEALSAVKADAVLNVTPPAFHKESCFMALEAGLPVLCEKPLADTRAEAHALAQKAAQTGVLLMVAHNYRYSAVAQTVKRLLMSGELGAVSGVGVQFFKAPRLVGFRAEMPQPLLVDMAIHHFDMLRFFLEANPTRIYAETWNPPYTWFKGDASAIVTAEFPNGAHFNYYATWCGQGRETTWNGNWRFECERGMILIEEDAVYVQRVNGVDDRGRYYHTAYGELMQQPLVDMPLQAQDYLLHEFYTAADQGSTPGTTAADNVHTIDFVFDAVESAARRAPIDQRSA